MAAAAPLTTRLPNLIVLGAMKCGTTALHRYLAAHPGVAMARPKEMNFFVGPDRPGPGHDWHAGNWHRGPAWYAGHFPAGAAVRGEASPSYTSPAFPEAAERMAATVPGARLVYLVRDPLDRAVSQYRHHRADGTERRPLAEALLDPGSQYVERSRFHDRLAPYLRWFRREQVRVVLQEDLLADPGRTVAGILRFAGVDDEPGVPGGDRRAASRPPVDAGLASRFAAAVADDVARLRALTGRDLSEWRRY